MKQKLPFRMNSSQQTCKNKADMKYGMIISYFIDFPEFNRNRKTKEW